MRWIATTESAPYATATATPAKPGTAAPEALLALDGTRHQPWEGTGGCFNELGWDALQLLTPADRAAVFKDLFHPTGGCRFNLGRVPVGASDYALEWYSSHEFPGDHSLSKFNIDRDRGCLLPYIKTALAEAPLMLFASPWSPPTWMKQPKAYNYGTLVWTPEIRDTYARYLVKFVEAYRAEGVPIAQMHVQNEPLADQKFPSCKWTGQQLREFIRDDLGPALQKAGENCEVWLGTLNGNDFGDDYPQYILAPMTDAACRKHIAGVGIQWASKRMMARIHAAFPDLRLYQTENECGDGKNTWDHALYVFSLMQHYVTNGARAYVYWNMMLRPGGESTWGWKQNAMLAIDPATGKCTKNPEYWIMRHLSEHVRPGAVRLGLSGSWNGCSFAFANPDGGTVILTYNPLTESRRVRVDLPTGAVDLDLAPRSVHTLIL